MYLNSINYFRAISIMFIVSGHCLGLANFSYESIIGKTLHNLTQGGTSFFVFISGFLFHHIFYTNFQFKNFITKKLKYIILPYIVLSIIPLIYFVFQSNLSLDNTFSYIKLIISYIITGRHMIAYWYIPFIMIIFAMSPIHVLFIRFRLINQLLITILLLIGSVFIHRPIPSYFIDFQSVFYFTPIYLLGMICSEKKELIYSRLIGKELYLLSLAIIFAIIQVFLGKVGNYHKNPFEYRGIDILIIQKIILSVFFIVWLHRFEKNKNKFLNLIASNSFGIFFIHGIFITGFYKVKEHFNFSFPPNSFIIYFSVVIIIFFLSLISTSIVKKIAPKYSRYLVGS